MTVIAGGLITLEYAASGLKYTNVGSVSNPDNSARDADLTVYVQAATPVVENIIGSALSISKTINFDGGYPSLDLNDRVQSLTTIVENGTTLVSGTDYYYNPTPQTIYRGVQPWPVGVFASGFGNISVTYLAGYAVVPAHVQLATRELVRFWIEQGNQANRPAFGDGVESTPWAPQGFAVPKRVIELLAPERTLGGFA